MSSKISTFSPYNDGSVGSFLFDGTSDHITSPNSADFNFGSSDFTIEGWFYPLQTSTTFPTVISISNVNAASDSSIYINFGSVGMGFYVSDGTDWDYYIDNTSGAASIVNDNWYHAAWVRNGDALFTYINGVYNATTALSTNFTLASTSRDLFIGLQDGSSANYYSGFISDLRVVKGNAVYSGTSSFIPPTTALTNISGTGYSTVLLVQPGNNANLNRDTAAPEDRKVFAAISAGIGQEPQTVINEGTSITSSGADTATYNYQCAQCVPALPEGKWYFEVRDRFYYLNIGLMPADVRFTEGPLTGNGIGSRNNTLVFSYSGNLQLKREDGTADSSYVTTGVGASPGNPGTGDIFSIDYDTVTNTFGISKNGGTRYTHVIPTSDYVMLGKRIGMADGSSGGQGNLQLNFGQNPTFNGNITPSGGTNSDGSYPDADGIGGFRYAPPTGYKALRFVGPSRPSGLNKAALAPDKHFGTLLYEGTGADGYRIRGLNFKPDLVWLKSRSAAFSHFLFDSVRGKHKDLNPNGTDVEGDSSTYLQSFNDDGFTVGTGGGSVNQDGGDIVAWCWKAGEDSFINTDGTIDSECSVNQDAGFSIVSYVGNGTAGATVGHGLTKVPQMIIIKTRQTSNDWAVYHSGIGSNYRMDLNTSDAQLDQVSFMNDTAPTSTAFSLGTASSVNADNSTFIAYCWHSVEGYSKFGSYDGNGNADGPFIYLGFKPAWVMVKEVDNTGNWIMWDNKRNPSNETNLYLIADDSAAEVTAGNPKVDFLSNGFKIRGASGSTNTSSSTHIYMAFAETPSAFTNSR